MDRQLHGAELQDGPQVPEDEPGGVRTLRGGVRSEAPQTGGVQGVHCGQASDLSRHQRGADA